MKTKSAILILPFVAGLAAPGAARAGVIPGCEDGSCGYAFAAVFGDSSAPTESSGPALFRVSEEDGGYGYRSAGAALLTTSPHGATLQGDATAVLASGALHASTEQFQATTTAEARIADTLLFSLPPGMTEAVITVSWTLEGAFTMTALSNAQLGGGTHFKLMDFNRRGVEFDQWDFPFDYTTGLEYFEGDGPHTGTLTAKMTVRAGVYYYLDAALSVSAWPNVEKVINGEYFYYAASSAANFGDTSYFSFDLPEGVSFDSGSGVLLDAPYTPGGAVTPVPEPSTWAMIVAGFGGLALLAARRRRAIA